MKNYPIVPGRGLVTPNSTSMRLNYLDELGLNVDEISSHGLSLPSVQNKIESFIGSVEIPVGLVGPLLFNNGDKPELVHGVVATLEGALVASMNRGCKAISMSGGFQSIFIHQRMVRCPMFIFENIIESDIFSKWIDKNFESLKKECESHSNHAKLIEINPSISGNSVHTRFVYTTGDASGQNMTTTCTWHGMIWIVKHFTQETGIEIQYHVIEGNGSSDKKVSARSVIEGRGIHVVADCFLEESVIHKVLRTTADNILKCYSPSVVATRMDSMVGYNINVANAIASIFAATGQDLACIHESSVGILNLEKKENGLYLSLNLPCLVIGTAGGGTSLEKQNQALQMMGCTGNGTIERFAKLIAGFALSLEISTYAAIVSGEFAKAHEKLGRNKPINWLVKSELTKEFIKDVLNPIFPIEHSSEINFKELGIENGIITNLTSRISKKLLGFIPIEVENGDTFKRIIIKSKALDIDVIKGLHTMAASIDPNLSDLIYKHRKSTEYHNCHLKEIMMYELLNESDIIFTPKYFGNKRDKEREIYLLFMEQLDENELFLFNSENNPRLWEMNIIESTIEMITKAHKYLDAKRNSEIDKKLSTFIPSLNAKLYEKLISIIILEEENLAKKRELEVVSEFLNDLNDRSIVEQLPKTIIHNDFNPRNIAIRNSGEACIYDWELAVINIPHRDIVELTAFVLTDDFAENDFLSILAFHAKQWNKSLDDKIWLEGYIYSFKEFLVCRVTFYKAAEVLMKLKFIDRVLNNCLRMISILEQKKRLL